MPGRLLLDTCILHHLYEDGEFIFDGQPLMDRAGQEMLAELESLRYIFLVNQRAYFQLVVSPLTIAEIANIQDFGYRETHLRWVMDVLDHWLITLEGIGDRASEGGTVRHRFKLTPELQKLQHELMRIADFRRDPFDRLLLLQYRMGNCDAFLTTETDTIARHKNELSQLGFNILRPSEFWELLKPWANLWL